MDRNNRTTRARPSVDDLVTRAKTGDEQAWDALVERYAPLVWSICRGHRLDDADAGDVGQKVWLRLVSQLNQVRDPAALPGWLATTTQRECGNIRHGTRSSHAVGRVLDAGRIPDPRTGMAEHELLAAERHAALREAFTRLPPGCQRLIAVLVEDPPVPCAQISARLGIPAGSIGPSRSRCLEKLRRDQAVAVVMNAEAASAGGGTVRADSGAARTTAQADGTEYEIDRNAEHAHALRDALARYVSAARRGGGAARRPVRGRRKRSVSGLNTTEVREWARRRALTLKTAAVCLLIWWPGSRPPPESSPGCPRS